MATGNAKNDQNFTPALIGVSSADGETPVRVEVNPTTGAMLTEGGTGGDASAANQTSGAQKTQIVDSGGEAATVTGGKLDVNATASLAGAALPIASATEAVGVAIVDGSGNQITSFGGGTQYTEGDTDATITGTALLFEGAANALVAAPGTAANGLDVDVTRVTGTVTVDGSGVTQPVSGTVTANAGTGTLAVSNAGLTELAAAIDTEVQVDIVGALPAGTNNIGDVDVLSSALPTGASTSAKQDTGNTSLASIDGKITAVNTGAVVVSSSALPSGAATAAKQPALGTAGTSSADVITVQGRAAMTPLLTDGSGVTQPVSGTVAVTQSGTWDEVGINDSGNSITVDAVNLDVRDLSAASDAVTVHGDVGALDQLDLTNTNPIAAAIVDGDGTQITSFGGGTQYTEDAAAAANPVGTALNMVRDDARTGSLTTTDGDNVAARGTNSGELYVKHVDSVAITNAGLTELASAIDTELQVDVVAALPAGNNNIGDVDVASIAAGDNNIGNVDIVTLPGDVEADIDQIRDQIDLITPDIEEIRVDADAIRVATELIDDTVYTDDTSTHATGTSKGTGIMAVATPTDASVDANDIGMVAMTNARALKNDLTTIAGTAAVNGSGTATGALRVELPTNGTGVIATVGAVTAITNALPAGTNGIGKLTANSGVDIGDVDVTSISAGTNLVGDVGIQPRTTNGLDTFMASGSDGSAILVATAQAAKAAAGKVYGYYAYNPESAVTFVHFYNTAQGSVTVGTTNPLFTLPIPPTSAANLMSEIGITFGTAITVAATTTAGGNTAPATGVSLTLWYK